MGTKRIFLIRGGEPDLEDRQQKGYWQPQSILAEGAGARLDQSVAYFKDTLKIKRFDPYCYPNFNYLQQTVGKMRRQMGNESSSGLRVRPGLGPSKPQEWSRAYRALVEAGVAMEPTTVVPHGPENLVKPWLDLCRQNSQEVLEEINRVADNLGDGQAAALFTDNPLISGVQSLITGRECPESIFGHGDSLELIFEDRGEGEESTFVGARAHIL